MRDWARIVDAHARIWAAVKMDIRIADGADTDRHFDKQVSIKASGLEESLAYKDFA